MRRREISWGRHGEWDRAGSSAPESAEEEVTLTRRDIDKIDILRGAIMGLGVWAKAKSRNRESRTGRGSSRMRLRSNCL